MREKRLTNSLIGKTRENLRGFLLWYTPRMSASQHKETGIILDVRDVTKQFQTPQGPLTIIEHVSFSIQNGEKVAIIGPSGSGKSTLLSLIGLLDTPTSGSITIAGTNINTLSEPEQARFRNEHIGFIFQSYELIAPFTVTENIEAPLEIGGTARNPELTKVLIDGMGLSDRKDVLPYTLSGGEKQRVAIARALIHNPTLILADEPTGSLDTETGRRVLELLLERVAGSGKTLIVITHDEMVASRMDRVLEIRDRGVYERS
jgi:putative ABC transport system ATP-binding protein